MMYESMLHPRVIPLGPCVEVKPRRRGSRQASKRKNKALPPALPIMPIFHLAITVLLARLAPNVQPLPVARDLSLGTHTRDPMLQPPQHVKPKPKCQ